MSTQTEGLESKSTIPTVIYGEGVNLTTPYIISINPGVYALMLTDEFQLPENEIGKIGVHVLATESPLFPPSSGIDRPFHPLATAGLGGKVGSQRFKHIVTMYMGTIWNEYHSPKFANLFNSGTHWENTRLELVGTLAHEASHVQDLYHLSKKESRALSSIIRYLGVGLLYVLSKKKGTDSALSKAAGLGLAISSADIVVQGYQLIKAEAYYESHTQPKANEIGATIDIAKWTDLVTLEPNPAFLTPIQRLARRFIHI